MKKKLWILALVLIAALLVVFLFLRTREAFEKPETSAAPESAATDASSEPLETEEARQELPDSVLYYGEIKEIQKDDLGSIHKLIMDSERYGPYDMLIQEKTCFIDSGKRTALDPETLEAGTRVYVFCSPIAFRSMPPQSEAFAIVGNIPMDASCGMYHEIEEIRKEGEETLITTDNGGKTLGLDGEAQIFSYTGESLTADALKAGAFGIAWYWDRGEEVLRTTHFMLLP